MFRGGRKVLGGSMKMEKITACHPPQPGGQWILSKVLRKTMKSLCQQGEKNRDSIHDCRGCVRMIPQALGLWDLPLLGN